VIGKKLTYENKTRAARYLAKSLVGKYAITEGPSGILLSGRSVQYTTTVINIGDRIWGEWVKDL
jgi:hypothetical protein